jgi:outer membrane protein TolC
MDNDHVYQDWLLTLGHGEDYDSGALTIKPKTTRFPHPGCLVSLVISTLKFIFIITCTFMTFGLTVLSQPVQGASVIPEAGTLIPSGLLNFEEGIKIALQQSPYFKKSSLQIEISKLNETDSRYSLIPPLTFYTYYYASRPSGTSGTPFYLSFYTSPYNPIISYFNLQAQKLATQAAILAHLQAISSGLEQLGQIFLQLDYWKKLATWQQDLANLSQEELAYKGNRYSAGTATSLEVKQVKQGLKVDQNKLKLDLLLQKRALANWKTFLGLRSNPKITPDLRNILRQVLGNFDLNSATWEEAKSRSYELKILEIRMKLQGYNIKLAIVNAMPIPLFTYQTPNPLSSTAQGLYPAIGLQVPVWDGFTRIRNITRQKLVLQQYDNEKSLFVAESEDKFHQAREKVQEAASDLQAARSQVESAQLKAGQAEIRYHSGSVTLPDVIAARRAILEAKMNVAKKALAYGEAALAFRRISGDLGHAYVRASSWQD